MIGEAIAVVALGMTTLAYSKHAQDVTAQLERAQNELRELRGFRRRTPVSWEDSLRVFAGQQELPYPRFRGVSPSWAVGHRRDDGGRRRQAIDTWFQQSIAALDERARTTESKDAADVATQIVAALTKLNGLRTKWDDVRQMPEEVRRGVAQQLDNETVAVLSTLRDLSERDRQIRLADLARAMGHTDEQSIQNFIHRVTGAYDDSHYNPGRALADANLNPPSP